MLKRVEIRETVCFRRMWVKKMETRSKKGGSCLCSTELKEKLQCPICLEHQHLPVIFPCQHHTACHECIVKLLSIHRYASWCEGRFTTWADVGCRCPFCGEDSWFYDMEETSPIPPSILSICYKEHVLKCPYCLFKGTVASVQSHLSRSDCITYVCRECKVSYHNHLDHLKHCPSISCERCNFKGNYKSMVTHNECHDNLDKMKQDLENLNDGRYAITSDFVDMVAPMYAHFHDHLVLLRRID